jgi:hypothetical protein
MKTLLLVALSLVTVTSIQAQTLMDNLLLRYSFSGNTNDVSGNNYHAVGNATPANDRFGNPNEAYYFNGVDSYLDMPTAGALKPSYPVSVAFWVKYDDLDAANSPVFCTDYAQDNHTGVWVASSGAGNIAVSIGDNTGNTSASNRRTKIGTFVQVPGTWYHIAVVVNSKDDMEIYVDCVNVGGSYSGTGGELAYSSVPGSLGRKDSGNGIPANYFKGTIDELLYWDRALVATDIDTLCNGFVSVDDKEISKTINVYPNPTSQLLNIETEGVIRNLNIRDVNGRLLKTYETYAQNIDVSELDNGVYFVRFELDGELRSVKFIKK